MKIYKRLKVPIDWGGEENKVREFTLFDFQTTVQYRLPIIIKAVQYWPKGG